MLSTPRVFKIQRHAFRIDVNKTAISVPRQEIPAAEIDSQLQSRMQPKAARLKRRAIAAADDCIEAIDALVRERRIQLAAEKVDPELGFSWQRGGISLENLKIPVPKDAGLLFEKGAWNTGDIPHIIEFGMFSVFTNMTYERRPFIACMGDVVNGIMEFLIGHQVRKVLGVAAGTASQVKNPITSGVMDRVVAAMNMHAHYQPNVRHAWGIIVGPGCVRVCLMDNDGIYVSSVQKTTDYAGRLLLGNAAAFAAFAEPTVLGSDKTIRWRNKINCYEIKCYDPDTKRPHTFYYPYCPLFVSAHFFGRFTRCFGVSRSPYDDRVQYVLKDSCQAVHKELDDADLRDEIGILRKMSAALDDAWDDNYVVQRLLCGGTVLINGTRDTTELSLGAVLNSYQRQATSRVSTGVINTHRLHRRMVSGPVGIPLHKLRRRDAVFVVADAMLAYATILERTGIAHSDISLGNIVGVLQADGSLRGMLIDFDLAIAQREGVEKRRSCCVGTSPFQSIANIERLQVPRTAVDDWEAALALLFYLVAHSKYRDNVSSKLSKVEHDGTADMRRGLFSSLRAFSAAINMFADPQYVDEIKLIKGLPSDPDRPAKATAPTTPPARSRSTTREESSPKTPDGLGTEGKKHKAQDRASPMVERRKMAHDAVGAAPHPTLTSATAPP
ncbi:hypothetical protein GGH13_002034 [Coemansia sp. S155-1]|nr:hypothetical protein GGH13_002034 [Coemansia sp. S155-1]